MTATDGVIGEHIEAHRRSAHSEGTEADTPDPMPLRVIQEGAAPLAHGN